MKKIVLIFLALFLFLPNVQADEIKSFSIDDCVDIALKNDPNINVSRNFQKIAKSRVGQAKSDYFPSLTAGGGYTIQNNNNSGSNFISNSSSGNNYAQINLGINQLIWNFGKTIAKINMQKYNLESSVYDLDYAILNSVYRVKVSYFNVLAAKANLDIYERSVKINELHYERTKALFQEGLKSKIDVVNAEVYLTDAKIQVLNAENTYKTSLIGLNNAMYYTEAPEYTIQNTESFNFHKKTPIKNIIDVAYVVPKKGNLDDTAILTSGIEKRNIIQDFVFKPFSISMQEAIASAHSNRPDFKSLLMVEKAQLESLKAVKRMYMPELGVSGGYSFRDMNDKVNSGFNATVGLNFPAVNAMDVKYKIDEGKSYLDIATNNIDLSRKNIYFEVQNNYVNMVQLEKRIPLMGRKVAQTLENFELADGRYTVGLGNFIELQDAQTNYNNAQLAYVQSIFDYNLAKTQLEKSMGIKWERQL